MIPIVIDTSEISNTLNLLEEQSLQLADDVVKGLAIELHSEWTQLAKNSLGSTRQEYINSLILGDDGFLTSKVTLVGELPNDLEQGKGPWDMKPSFANSSKKKMTKSGGWFLTIPFRHAIPGSVGESSIFSSVLPSSVMKEMKAASDDKFRSMTGATSVSLPTKNLPQEFQTKGVRKELLNKETNEVFKAYAHKTAQYAGLTRISKQYESASQSQYMTFRRVSDKSDPDSWIHPGFTALKLGEKALASMDISSTIAKVKDEFIDSL